MDQHTKASSPFSDEEEFERPTRYMQPRMPRMVGLVLRYSGGLVRDERTAQYVLLGFVVLAVVFTFFMFSRSDEPKVRFVAPPGSKIIYPNNAPPRLQAGY